MACVFIYTLNCPTSGSVRYVGKAKNPDRRFIEHFRTRERGHKTNWIKSLGSIGLKPVLEIIDEVSESEWPMWEAAYIQFFREDGCNLVNATEGGDGASGRSLSTEHRAKIRIASLGRRHSQETISKIRSASLLHRHSLVTRNKIRLANLGRKRSVESCKKQSSTIRSNKI